MVIQLDPHIPLVWRTPHSLQFGVDQPCVVLDSVSIAEERVIAALLSGTSQSAIEMIAKSLSLGHDDLLRLLATLQPALMQREATVVRTVSLSGIGMTVAAISDLLARSGVHVQPDLAGTEPSPQPALAIIVAHFVVDPDLHGRWLSRDVPHLGVVFGDRVVRIGPLVTPGSSACLICLELHARDADPAHAALSSQLWGRMSAAETALVATEVAAICSRIVVNFLSEPRTTAPVRLSLAGVRRNSATRSIELDVGTGLRSEKVHLPHPECGCATIDRVEVAHAPTLVR